MVFQNEKVKGGKELSKHFVKATFNSEKAETLH